MIIGNYNITEYDATLHIDNGYDYVIINKDFEVVDLDMKYIAINKGLFQFRDIQTLFKFITFVTNWQNTNTKLVFKNKGEFKPEEKGEK